MVFFATFINRRVLEQDRHSYLLRYFKGAILKCGFLKKSFIMNAPLDILALLSSLLGAYKQQTHQKVMTNVLNWPEMHS